MAGPQTVWGLDVGRSALKALKLRASGEGTIELVAAEFIEHASILSEANVNRAELISAALEKFLSRNDVSRDQVVVQVPGQHTLSRFTKLPPVAPKRIPDIVRYEADQQIPFDLDEVIWDYQTFQQADLPDVEVGIFAMKRELLRAHLLHFEQASIEPVAVQPGPLALYNAAHFDGWLSNETTVLLDIGAENTDLVIATAHTLWTRTIPIGGNAMTDALVKAFKLSFAKAEALKRSADTSKYRRQILQAMRPVFADLVQELQRSIGFYSSTHRDAEIDKVVGLGNTFKLAGLQKYLQQNLGLPVELPADFSKAPASGAAAEVVKENRGSLAVAYGLCVQGLELGKVTSNLLPTEIAKQVVWRKKKPAFAATAACLLLAGGLVWFRYTADMRAIAASSEGASAVSVSLEQAPRVVENGPSPSRSPLAQAVEVQEACKTLASELNRLSSEGRTEREQVETVIALQHNKTLVPRLFEVIHQSLPRPDGPLGAAQTQEAVLAALSSAPPRGQRTQVFLDSVHMQFEPNLNAFDWPQSLQPAPPRIKDSPDEVLPGFEIKIKCRTPHERGPQFIDAGFMTPLRETGRKPGRGFFFDRVYLIDGGKVPSSSDEGGAKPKPGLGGFGVSATAQPPATTLSALDRDPITNEPVVNDWRFEIWIDVILEDFPEASSEGEEAGQGDEAADDE